MHCAADPRGHVLWTSSEAAAGACNAGVEGYAEFRADAMECLDAAIAADVEFALPKLVKAWVLHGARDAKYAPTIDIQNVASLLLRLEMRGIDVGDRWTDLAEVCAGRVHDHANAFSNVHDVMVLAATGQFAQADELVESAERFAASGDGTLHMSYRAAGVAACRAMLAHRRGDYESVVALLAPVRHDLALFGGSHAQRDIFYQVLVDACRRLGRSDLVAIFVRDAYRIGFDRVESRSLYCDATEPTQSAEWLSA